MNTVSAHVAVRRARLAPWTGVAPLVAFAGVLLLSWSLLPLLTGWDVPADNLEQMAWALTPDWGYAKHPPFPTWLLIGLRHVLPDGLWLTYLLGGAQVALMMTVAYRLTAELLGRHAATLAVLFIGILTYYTQRLHYYNHNTALMCAQAIACLAAWRALMRGGTAWWLLLGVAWGVGMLSKYQMVIGIACNVAWLAIATNATPWRAERRDVLRGVLLAGAVAALVTLPHVVWLVRNDFPTFGYASHSLAANLPLRARPRNIGAFLGNQVGRCVPALLLALLLIALERRADPRGDIALASDREVHASAPGRWFLTVNAVGPFVLMTALSAVAGVDLQMHWGTAYLWMIVPLALATRVGHRLLHVPPIRVYAGVLLVHLLTLAAHAR